MFRSLFIYSSTDGHTKTICENIISYAPSTSSIKLISLNEVSNIKISEYDKIIIGASIRYGRHNRKVLDFVKKNKNALDLKKTAFFSVNVVARKLEKNSPTTNPYVIKFLKKTNWKPNNIAVFAGKVDYPNYNFINKNIIRFIMMITNGPTDTSQSFEFTNWEEVKKFAKDIKI